MNFQEKKALLDKKILTIVIPSIVYYIDELIDKTLGIGIPQGFKSEKRSITLHHNPAECGIWIGSTINGPEIVIYYNPDRMYEITIENLNYLKLNNPTIITDLLTASKELKSAYDLIDNLLIKCDEADIKKLTRKILLEKHNNS